MAFCLLYNQQNWTSYHFVTALALGKQHKGHKDQYSCQTKSKVY